MAAEASEPSHWNAYAARFGLVGPPLRPGRADTQHLYESVKRHARRRPGSESTETALLLGVTPEIAELDWDPPFELLAVDKSEGMVKAIWPGDRARRRAVVGDWLELTPPNEGFALALGDGVFSIFEYPTGYAELGRALGRVVRPGGLLWLRLFCRPEQSESVSEVLEALGAKSIGNFHVFKWRLAMALQGDATAGVRLADIWDTFESAAGGVEHVARHSGFREPEVATIEAYRGVQDCYSFSTEAEVVTALQADFELLESWRPSYELGERCPHLTFRRRA
jgi:hypothetical protein